jgi:glyoxylase-like metal-dependent hydrolase (beta-lactamase superfamily II)
VRWAFITHAHRDHIAGWTHVPQATFVLGRDEVPLFTGTASYKGLVPRLADNLNGYRRPTRSEVTVLAVGGDTLFAFGRDTLRAYAVPGHTPGSTAYLFRGTLFVGDAANWGVVRGFRGALTCSDSAGRAARACDHCWRDWTRRAFLACCARRRSAAWFSSLREDHPIAVVPSRSPQQRRRMPSTAC